ncbi:MAG TPA: hypothetical protein PKW26_06610 [Treponemataceae bacterium]|nr:hypothetical protein [Treponemataceae bacterium]HOQ93273.1 hypothetical protein [Treponemataceae bacterium]
MKILEIKNIVSEENHIYYRRKFSSIAVVQIPQRQIEFPFQFIIETAPTGNKNIEITIPETIDYPLLPVVRALKHKINQFDAEGYLK